MFGHRYFGRYFGARYFGPSDVSSVAPPVAGPSVGSYTVQIAWAPGSFTNISADVVHINITRPLWTLFDAVTPGQMEIEVINISGKYTPDNAAGPFAGLMKNGREARVFGSVEAGTSQQLFQGFLDQISLPANDLNNGRVNLSFRDRARELRHRVISTSLWVDYNITSLFNNVLMAAGVNSADQSIQAMPDEADLGWFRDVAADSAIADMIAFNFSRGFVGRTGIINILSRYYQGQTNVHSYSAFLGLDYLLDDDAVINDARFESDPREVSTTPSTLSYITQPITIQASQSVSFVLEYLDPITRRGVPAVNMVTPVASAEAPPAEPGSIPGTYADYRVGTVPGTGSNATATTSVTVQFFGETAVATVFNGTGETVFLNQFQLRGQHLPDSSKLQVITISSSSQAVYGRRSFFLSSALLGDVDYLRGYGAFLVDRHKDAIPSVRVVVRNEITSADLALDPSGLITISNSNTAIGSLHFIKRLEHDIDMSSGVQHTISMDLERYADYNIWTLGHATLGDLDSGNTLAF